MASRNLTHPTPSLLFIPSRQYPFHEHYPSQNHSLSLTLQHFYPLAGTFTWPLQAIKPQLQWKQLWCYAHNSRANLDFNSLVSDHPRHENEFDPLVPQLTLANKHAEVPVVALQVTFFPNIGISIGISFLHLVADGRSSNHFMKSRASVCKSELGDTCCLQPESQPFFDGTVINDPNNLETIYLNELAKLGILEQSFHKPSTPTNMIWATFVLDRADIQKIKRLVQDQLSDNAAMDIPPSLHLTIFVLTCSYVWVCLTKVQANEDVDEMKREHIIFPVDCRERLNPPIPTTYFGNCLMPCFVDVKRNDLIGKHGITIAAEAIGNEIQRMNEEGVLTGSENLFSKAKLIIKGGRFLCIAGSPKLGVYDTDIGRGRTTKSEVISIDTNGAISLNECREMETGDLKLAWSSTSSKWVPLC